MIVRILKVVTSENTNHSLSRSNISLIDHGFNKCEIVNKSASSLTQCSVNSLHLSLRS